MVKLIFLWNTEWSMIKCKHTHVACFIVLSIDFLYKFFSDGTIPIFFLDSCSFPMQFPDTIPILSKFLFYFIKYIVNFFQINWH